MKELETNKSILLEEATENQLYDLVDKFRILTEDYKRLATSIMQGWSFDIDKIALSVLNRAIAINEGFRLLVMEKHTYAAEHFIRIQLDSLIRFYSFYIYEDDRYIQWVLDGKAINKFEDKILKTKFFDGYLAKRIGEVNSNIQELYIKYCGVIHFGQSHLNKAISFPEKDGVKYSVKVGDLDGYLMADKIILVSDMIKASIELFDLVNSWLKFKTEELI